MADLNSLAKRCGQKNPPATKIDLYYTPSCELNGFPDTRNNVSAGVAPGDTKILDEPFDFSTAPSGKGFWRKASILVDTGRVKDTLEGEVGGQGHTSAFDFFLPGTDAAELEFADAIVDNSGNLVMMIQDMNGNWRVLGTDQRPAMVVSNELDTGAKVGERRGGAYSVSAYTGRTAPIYDAATHAIKITANV